VKISVVIPCRNEARHIGAFLESLSNQEAVGIELEILVADGESDDGTGKLLATYCEKDPRVRIISNPGRIVSTGLNAAIEAARGDIIVRMDVHAEYASDYIKTCLEVLQSTGAWNVGGPARTRASGTMGRAIAAAYGSPFSTGGAKFHDENYEGFVDTVTYGCWRKTTLERLGMFDEALVRNQDDELNLRTIRAGGTIWQSPNIVSWYKPRSSLRALFRQYFQYGYWKVAVIRKHSVPASWRHLVPGLFVSLNIFLFAGTLAAWLLGYESAFRMLVLCLGLSLGSYFIGLLVASAHGGRKAGLKAGLMLPIVFATYHVSYGLGFLAGLARGPVQSGRVEPTEDVFSALSR